MAGLCVAALASSAAAPPSSATAPPPLPAVPGSAEETNETLMAASEAGPADTTNLLSSFRLKAGFRIELVADAPKVAAPVAMAFDENGRLFVAEMRDYPSRREATPHLGRIRLLEDKTGNGKFETSTVFADDLPLPSALACYDGGIFVAVTPNILYLKDTTGTGVANLRRWAFTGFGGTNAPRSDALLNNFNWGLDNRIHGVTAGIGGIVTVSNEPGIGPVSLAGSDFAFDPRVLALSPEAGPALSGLSFDARARRFTCDYARPLRLAMYEPQDAARNPFVPHLRPIIDVASPATPIFRLVSVPLPAPPRRTAGDTNQPAPSASPTNALAPAWLTLGRGLVVYRGSAFPSNYFGNVFIADSSARVIHRMVLSESGLEPVARRAPEEAGVEFLSSSDPSFRPRQIVNGPDGVLYVADFRDGSDTGRIYRIVPAGFKRPEPPRLGQASTRDLVVALAHADGWHSDTAARLLYERRDQAAVPLLANMLANSRLPLARLHALRAIEGFGALTEARALVALRDTDYRVRERAVIAAETLSGGTNSDNFWNALKNLGSDPSICVRYQLAFSLGGLRREYAVPILAKIVARDPGDRWIREAVLSAASGCGAELLVALAGDAQFRTGTPFEEFVRQIAVMVGIEANQDEVTRVQDFITRASLDPALSLGLLRALGDGLHRARSSLALTDPVNHLQPFYAEALRAAAGRSTPEPLRLEAIQLLGVGPYTFSDTGDVLLLTLGSGDSPAVQAAALAALGRYEDPRLVRSLVARWQVVPPTLRGQAAAALLARTNRIAEVLGALESGQIPPSDLPPAQLNLLRTAPDPALRQRAIHLLGAPSLHRPAVVQRFRAAFSLKGYAERGKVFFRDRCAACHQLGGEGQALGPNVIAAKLSGREQILAAMLEPNVSVRAGYTTYVFQTEPGDVLIGLQGDENLKTVTVRQPNGIQAVWPRDSLASIQAQTWSLMPDNLEQGLSTQDVADLLDFIMVSAR